MGGAFTVAFQNPSQSSFGVDMSVFPISKHFARESTLRRKTTQARERRKQPESAELGLTSNLYSSSISLPPFAQKAIGNNSKWLISSQNKTTWEIYKVPTYHRQATALPHFLTKSNILKTYLFYHMFTFFASSFYSFLMELQHIPKALDSIQQTSKKSLRFFKFWLKPGDKSSSYT